jgi:hypothetical protein
MPSVMRQAKAKAAIASSRLATMSQTRLNFFGAFAVKKSTMMWPRIIWQKGSAMVTATADIICTSS